MMRTVLRRSACAAAAAVVVADGADVVVVDDVPGFDAAISVSATKFSAVVVPAAAAAAAESMSTASSPATGLERSSAASARKLRQGQPRGRGAAGAETPGLRPDSLLLLLLLLRLLLLLLLGVLLLACGCASPLKGESKLVGRGLSRDAKYVLWCRCIVEE
jgi:hypothetical protein